MHGKSVTKSNLSYVISHSANIGQTDWEQNKRIPIQFSNAISTLRCHMAQQMVNERGIKRYHRLDNGPIVPRFFPRTLLEPSRIPPLLLELSPISKPPHPKQKCIDLRERLIETRSNSGSPPKSKIPMDPPSVTPKGDTKLYRKSRFSAPLRAPHSRVLCVVRSICYRHIAALFVFIRPFSRARSHTHTHTASAAFYAAPSLIDPINPHSRFAHWTRAEAVVSLQAAKPSVLIKRSHTLRFWRTCVCSAVGVAQR